MFAAVGPRAALLGVLVGCGAPDSAGTDAAQNGPNGNETGAALLGAGDAEGTNLGAAGDLGLPGQGAPAESSTQHDGYAATGATAPGDASATADRALPAGGDGSAPVGRWLGADTGMSTIPVLEGLTGANLRVHLVFTNWTQSWGNQFSFTANTITKDVASGVATMMTWSPNDTIPNVLTGMYDAYLHQWAKDAKADGRRFLLRMAHEANGNWYAWNYAGGVPATKFADMWRHAHDIFTAEGATNVQWVFCPNSVGPGIVDFTNAYPGDTYVDYVGLDSYNFATNGAWHTFPDIFVSSYKLMQSLTKKPLILCETASAEDARDASRKGNWITDAFENTIPNLMPNVIGVIWFNEMGPPNWQVDTSMASLAAFKAVVADPKWQAAFPGFP